jgi:hypothetical protein
MAALSVLACSTPAGARAARRQPARRDLLLGGFGLLLLGDAPAQAADEDAASVPAAKLAKPYVRKQREEYALLLRTERACLSPKLRLR